MRLEEQLLLDGITQLSALLPLGQVTFETASNGKRHDAVIQLQLGNATMNLTLEVKRSAQRIVWGQLLEQLDGADHPLLITDYINQPLGEKLRKQGINYLDTAGNVYLKIESNGLPLFVWIDGQKQPKRREEKADHAFTKAGLRVTYWLLTHPDQADETVRTIAKGAGASLETVHRVKASLQLRGFLVEIRTNEWRLTNRKALLDKWIEAYAVRLQPGLLRGRYRLLKNESTDDWEKRAIETPLTQWGGEPAADALTKYLRPAEWIIYTHQPTQAVMKQLRLLPDSETGPVRVYEKFWPQDEPGSFVHPLLVYADLLISQDARNKETAKKLFESHVQSLLD